MITPDLLVAAVNCTRERAELFAPYLRAACSAFDIDRPTRLAAFLAQIGHESGSFRYVREIASGEAYEGRKDLGNRQPGDGVRYRGRGLIQLTGRFNYAWLCSYLGQHGVGAPDFEAQPEALEQPQWAAWSAAAFWHSRGLNELADAGDFERITRKINGGLNGQADRLKRWEHAKQALAGAQPAPPPQEQPMPAPFLLAAAAPAFISAAASAIADAVPKLGELFAGESPVAKRNVEAAKIAVEAVKGALGASNEQEVVEKLQTGGPEVVQAAQQAVEENWYRLHEASEKSVAAAREHAMRYSQMKDVRTVAWGFTFIELLSLVLVVPSLLGGMAMVLWGDLTPELKGAVVTLILIGGFTGVKEFWFGSSHGSKAKDGSESRPA